MTGLGPKQSLTANGQNGWKAVLRQFGSRSEQSQAGTLQTTVSINHELSARRSVNVSKPLSSALPPADVMLKFPWATIYILPSPTSHRVRSAMFKDAWSRLRAPITSFTQASAVAMPILLKGGMSSTISTSSASQASAPATSPRSRVSRNCSTARAACDLSSIAGPFLTLFCLPHRSSWQRKAVFKIGRSPKLL